MKGKKLSRRLEPYLYLVPVLVLFGIFTFINGWNAYMWPLLITNTDTMRTVQIGIGMLLDAESADYNVMMAGVIIVMLPTLLLFTLGQKYILSGALAGAVKG